VTFANQTTTPCASGAHDNLQYTVTNPTALNRVSGLTYDAAGNVLNDGKNVYLYDPEGRLCAVEYPNGSGGNYYEQYLYDASGVRVDKGSLQSWPSSCNAPTAANGFTLSNQYLLGLGGEQVTELNGSGAVQHTNVFPGGGLLATYDFAHGGLHFALSDPLGTRRVQVSGAGTPELNCLSLPFGNSLGNARATNCVPAPGSLAVAPDATEHHFTGKERDTESGNDYFEARYYGSSLGRFLSTDNGKDQHVENPQSWNLYSYGRNNPLIGTDEDEHTYNVCPAGGGECAPVDDIPFEAEKMADQANGVVYSNGTISQKDANGNMVVVATYTHDPDIAGDPAANIAAMGRIGNEGMAGVKWFGEQMLWNVAGGFAGHGIGLALDALAASRFGGAVAEVLTKAVSAVGNTGVKVASREVAEQAAKEWVGEGAEPIYASHGSGPQIGWKSADGAKVARFTSAETKGYINLVNNTTGSNLHVRW
jgi:RHS repeat-associated protein